MEDSGFGDSYVTVETHGCYGYEEPISLSDEYLHPYGVLHYSSLTEYKNFNLSNENAYAALHGSVVLDLSSKALSSSIDDHMLNRDKKSLKVLNLEYNQYTEFPKEVLKLTSLNYLNLASQMTPRRASFTNWPALNSIPKDIDRLKNLTHLILCNNAIQKLPANIGKLRHLIHLDLSLNWLKEFPECICEISTLQTLYLSGNYIEHVPECVNKLLSLTCLRLGKNKLKELPMELCDVQSLVFLSIRNNEITSLPSKLYLLKGLLPKCSADKSLLLEGNPLVFPPAKVVAKGTQSVFKYLYENPPTKSDVSVKQKLKETKKESKRESTVKAKTQSEEIMDNLKMAVDSSGLTFSKETPTDGNCFFHAIEDQLYRPELHISQYSFKELRSQVAAYMEQDEEIVSWLDKTGRSVEQYMKDMAQDGTWVDDATVKATAKWLKRDIHVITSSPEQFKKGNTTLLGHAFKGGVGEPLYLGHYHECHYQSLRYSRDGKKSCSYAVIDCQLMSNTCKRLDLSGKNLEELPVDLEKFNVLEDLILDENCFITGSWMKDVLKLKDNLLRLSLKSQKGIQNAEKTYGILITIPENIYLCRELTHLILSNNKISFIREEVGLIPKLKVLDLTNNDISSLPPAIFDHLKHLRYLGLSCNRIATIPNEIAKLQKLKVLRMSQNKLNVLPEDICKLQSLMCISLVNNDIRWLPVEFNCLTQLLSGEVFHCDLLDKPHFKSGLYLDRNLKLRVPPLDVLYNDKGNYAKSVFEFYTQYDRQQIKNLIEITNRDSFPFSSFHQPDTDNSCTANYEHLTDKFLNKLSKNMGHEWEDVAIHLGMDQPTLQRIKMDHPRTKKAIFEMLISWRNETIMNKSEEELVNMLVIALKSSERNDVATKIKDAYEQWKSQQ